MVEDIRRERLVGMLTKVNIIIGIINTMPPFDPIASDDLHLVEDMVRRWQRDLEKALDR